MAARAGRGPGELAAWLAPEAALAQGIPAVAEEAGSLDSDPRKGCAATLRLVAAAKAPQRVFLCFFGYALGYPLETSRTLRNIGQ